MFFFFPHPTLWEVCVFFIWLGYRSAKNPRDAMSPLFLVGVWETKPTKTSRWNKVIFPFPTPRHHQDGIILLMEEILRQLTGSLSHYLQGLLHPRWCMISTINSYSMFRLGDSELNLRHCHPGKGTNPRWNGGRGSDQFAKTFARMFHHWTCLEWVSTWNLGR